MCVFLSCYLAFLVESSWFLRLFSFNALCLGDSQFLEDESTKIFARKVADHYSARSNQTLEEREASPIIHLKKLNNWVCVVFSDI